MPFSFDLPARQVPVRKSVDVLVVGGGSAGTAAAIAAARSGADVLLVERHGFLGGIMTAATLGTICGLYGLDENENITKQVGGIGAEIVSRLYDKGGAAPLKRWIGAITVPYDFFSLKTVLDDMIRRDHVPCAFHALVTDVIMEDRKFCGVVVSDKSGVWAVAAKTVVDATGDADLVALCGGEYEFDRENLQLPTTTFRFAGVNDDIARSVTREDLKVHLGRAIEAGHQLPRICGGMYFERTGLAHLNVTRVSLDGRSPNPLDTDELTYAEIEGRRQVLDYERAFKAFVPGFEDAFVIDCGAHIGVRETRRIIGDYTITGQEARDGASFDDAIACCSWPVEAHGQGLDTRWDWLNPGTFYQIPLRSLLPRTLDNVIVAGRCISADREAQASLRVTGTCMAMGEAAGIAASLASRNGGVIRAVPFADLKAEMTRRDCITAPVPLDPATGNGQGGARVEGGQNAHVQ